jgi:hypothetical protein
MLWKVGAFMLKEYGDILVAQQERLEEMRASL